MGSEKKLLSIENLVTKGHQLINNVIVIGGKTLQPLNLTKMCDELTYYVGKMQTDELWSLTADSLTAVSVEME